KSLDLFLAVGAQPVLHLGLRRLGGPVGYQSLGNLIKVVCQNSVHSFASLRGNGGTVAHETQILYIVVISEEGVQILAHALADSYVVAHNIAYKVFMLKSLNQAVVNYQLHTGIYDGLSRAS